MDKRRLRIRRMLRFATAFWVVGAVFWTYPLFVNSPGPVEPWKWLVPASAVVAAVLTSVAARRVGGDGGRPR